MNELQKKHYKVLVDGLKNAISNRNNLVKQERNVIEELYKVEATLPRAVKKYLKMLGENQDEINRSIKAIDDFLKNL
jgi:hypothetical protein